uniref:Uncharacterized protein n=1 Tax=Anguilla anguilla TaxID=7936 RepID=A0A0E9W2B4_ANGAN
MNIRYVLLPALLITRVDYLLYNTRGCLVWLLLQDCFLRYGIEPTFLFSFHPV